MSCVILWTAIPDSRLHAAAWHLSSKNRKSQNLGYRFIEVCSSEISLPRFIEVCSKHKSWLVTRIQKDQRWAKHITQTLAYTIAHSKAIYETYSDHFVPDWCAAACFEQPCVPRVQAWFCVLNVVLWWKHNSESKAVRVSSIRQERWNREYESRKRWMRL